MLMFEDRELDDGLAVEGRERLNLEARSRSPQSGLGISPERSGGVLHCIGNSLTLTARSVDVLHPGESASREPRAPD